MDIRSLRRLGILLAVGCWLAILAIRWLVFGEPISAASALFELAAIASGSWVFWNWVARLLHRKEREIQQHVGHLEALHQAGLSLTTELDLETVLQKVVDLARDLIHAEYGALSVMDEQGDTVVQFITSGMSAETRACIGDLPQGDGLLAAVQQEGLSVRIPEISRDPRAAGFPPHHPPMHAFLGVPLVCKGRTVGSIYLTNKLAQDDEPALPADRPGASAFSQEDQGILERFATQAAIAIENARLYRRNEQIAILEERDRFGMDLHDGVIQSIYAVGLMLDDARHRLDAEPHLVSVRLADAIDGLNEAIADIRSYIKDLRTHRFRGRNLQQRLEEMARRVESDSLINVHLAVDPATSDLVSTRQASELIHVAQEALTNVRRHANARTVGVHLARTDRQLLMTIEDDGQGFDPTSTASRAGNGLHNMHERVQAVGGVFQLDSAPGRGTRIRVTVPLSSIVGQLSRN